MPSGSWRYSHRKSLTCRAGAPRAAEVHRTARRIAQAHVPHRGVSFSSLPPAHTAPAVAARFRSAMTSSPMLAGNAL